MFQRLQKNFNLDFLDKLAEEEEQQKQRSKNATDGSQPQRSDRIVPANERKASTSRVQAANGRQKEVSPAREADPAEFDIGEDTAEASRSAVTTQPAGTNSAEASGKDVGSEEAKTPKMAESATAEDDLPVEVKQKLQKLATLTTRYQNLLKNYRTAHAHVTAIEPFEAALREHTPLTSISDPAALVEFLNNRTLQSDMVMNEFKRVSAENREIIKERDELRAKTEEGESQLKDVQAEVASLREERDQLQKDANESKAATETSADPLGVSAAPDHRDEKMKELEAEVRSQVEFINELSTENASMREAQDNMQRNNELTRLDLSAMVNKVGVKEEHIRGFQLELATTRKQLEEAQTARDDARKEQEKVSISLLKAEAAQKSLENRLTEQETDLQSKIRTAEDKLKRSQDEHAENVKKGKYVQREEKQMETLRSVVDTLRGQVKAAGIAQTDAENKVNDLKFEITRLESEARASQTIVATLRTKEAASDSLRKKLLDAERERDDMQRLVDSKKGHEHAVANLSSQLKRAEKERDSAYQMIIECGKCNVPGANASKPSTNAKAADVASTTANAPSDTRSQADSEHADAASLVEAEGAAMDGADNAENGQSADAKKKSKKKKSKAKKKPTTDEPETAVPEQPAENIPTLEDLQRNPALINELLHRVKGNDNPVIPLLLNLVENMRERNDSRDEDHDQVLRHHEALYEEQSQKLQDHEMLIRAKTDEIYQLQQSISNANTGAADAAEKEAQIEILRKQISALQTDLAAKDSEIDALLERLHGEATLQEKIDDLTEELESVKSDMVEHGSKAVDALHELKTLKDSKRKLQEELDNVQEQHDTLQSKLRVVQTRADEMEKLQNSQVKAEDLQNVLSQLEAVNTEKSALQVAKDAAEKQIEQLKALSSSQGVETDAKHKALNSDLDRLKSKALELEKELAAANQLAQTRFKDLTAVKDLYNKNQAELKKFRDEINELKITKTELDKANGSLKRLESKEKDLRSEITVYKSQLTGKEMEISSLNDKIKKSNEKSAAMEESFENARKELEKSENVRDEAVEVRAKLQADLRKAEEELSKARPKLDELQKQIKKFSEEASQLRDEVELKTAQQASAQSQMHSQENETHELSTQMKEVRQRNLNLQEELADAERMLSERSRDAETMRRMLNDAQSRAETRVKEMRDKMDLAIEERDRADDELSSMGRKRTREVEELKMKLRDAEHDAQRAKEARDDAEKKDKDSQALREDLRRRATQAQEELSEVRASLNGLQDSLDEGERHTRELEKERAELKRTLEDREAKLEKLTKSGKTMAEELRNLQAASKARQTNVPSSRSSTDSSRAATISTKKGAAALTTTGGDAVDAGYLKQVLLQFLEVKDKKYQMQLVPVLGRLLQFDQAEEQKWMSVVSSTK